MGLDDSLNGAGRSNGQIGVLDAFYLSGQAHMGPSHCLDMGLDLLQAGQAPSHQDHLRHVPGQQLSTDASHRTRSANYCRFCLTQGYLHLSGRFTYGLDSYSHSVTIASSHRDGEAFGYGDASVADYRSESP